MSLLKKFKRFPSASIITDPFVTVAIEYPFSVFSRLEQMFFDRKESICVEKCSRRKDDFSFMLFFFGINFIVYNPLFFVHNKMSCDSFFLELLRKGIMSRITSSEN